MIHRSEWALGQTYEACHPQTSETPPSQLCLPVSLIFDHTSRADPCNCPATVECEFLNLRTRHFVASVLQPGMITCKALCRRLPTEYTPMKGSLAYSSMTDATCRSTRLIASITLSVPSTTSKSGILLATPTISRNDSAKPRTASSWTCCAFMACDKMSNTRSRSAP